MRSVDTFSQGVVTTVSVDIFYEVWTFFVECGHFLSGVVSGHYNTCKCGHFL